MSGGQKQRLGLARAMYGDPSLIMLDEPNSNLDEVGEQALIQAIGDLRRHGKTIVIITHRSSVLQATTRLLVFVDGKAQLFGPTAQVLARLAKPRPAVCAASAVRIKIGLGTVNAGRPDERYDSTPEGGM